MIGFLDVRVCRACYLNIIGWVCGLGGETGTGVRMRNHR